MTGTVRRLKVNRRYAGSACGWCGDALALGEDGAVCEACEAPHHARCWDKENGCNGDPLCVNRPLQQIPQEQQLHEVRYQRVLGPSESICPTCGDITDGFCVRCSQAATPDWAYTGVRETAQDAKDALKYALAGFICCSLFGIVAIIKGAEAKRAIAANPRLDGATMATVAQVLGVIQLLLALLYILGSVARR